MKRVLISTAVAIAVSAGAAGAADAALVQFRSPSGNIGCMGETGSRNVVRCDIAAHTFRAPSKPGSCDFDWGNGFSVGRTGRARWNCVSDTVLGGGGVLRYGTSRRIGGITCTSSKAGMRLRQPPGPRLLPEPHDSHPLLGASDPAVVTPNHGPTAGRGSDRLPDR